MVKKSFKTKLLESQETNIAVQHNLADVWALVISPTAYIDEFKNINEAAFNVLKLASSIIQVRPAIAEASVVIFNLGLLDEFINKVGRSYENNNPELAGLYFGLPEIYKFIVSKAYSINEALESASSEDRKKALEELTLAGVSVV
jgi:hypothetical protein